MQTASAGGDEMESVKSYFNGTGFERWNKIYGETDEVNKVLPGSGVRDRHCASRGSARKTPAQGLLLRRCTHSMLDLDRKLLPTRLR